MILPPIKKVIKSLEYRSTTLMDCFLQLIYLLATVNKLPRGFNQEFQTDCLTIFNRRWNQFDFNLYLLSYFFHPKFRCKYNI